MMIKSILLVLLFVSLFCAAILWKSPSFVTTCFARSIKETIRIGSPKLHDLIFTDLRYPDWFRKLLALSPSEMMVLQRLLQINRFSTYTDWGKMIPLYYALYDRKQRQDFETLLSFPAGSPQFTLSCGILSDFAHASWGGLKATGIIRKVVKLDFVQDFLIRYLRQNDVSHVPAIFGLLQIVPEKELLQKRELFTSALLHFFQKHKDIFEVFMLVRVFMVLDPKRKIFYQLMLKYYVKVHEPINRRKFGNYVKRFTRVFVGYTRGNLISTKETSIIQDQCAATECEEKGKSLMQCSACGAVYYCCIAHQKNHRGAHKPICKILKKIRNSSDF